MISFDLEIFIIQMVIFIFFLLFTSRFIIRPVLGMAQRRIDLLSEKKSTAEKAEIKAADYLGMYRFDISSSHKNGAELIKSARKKASDDRFELMQNEKTKSNQYLSESRMKIIEAGETLKRGLKENEAELVSIICEKLWGGK